MPRAPARPTALLLAALAATLAVLSGCGSAKSKQAPPIADPQAEALSYAPAGAALVAEVQTGARTPGVRGTEAFVSRFTGGTILLASAKQALAGRLGLRYVSDVQPLLGNPVVLWAATADVTPNAAFVATDAARLADVLAAAVKDGRLRARGSADGARLYASTRGGALAVRGQVVVASTDLGEVRRALDRRAGPASGRLDPRAFLRRTAELPGGGRQAVLRATGPGRLLATLLQLPSTRWTRALGPGALQATATSRALIVDARIDTDPRGLTEQDLPLATGVQPPAPRAPAGAPVVAGVRDAAQTLGWAERARLPLLNGLTDLAGKVGVAGVDLDGAIVSRLTGTTTLSTDLDGGPIDVRAETDDPQPASAAIDRLLQLGRLSGIASLLGVDLGGYGVAGGRDGRLVVSKDGAALGAVDVQQGVLVASTDPSVDVDRVAGAPAPRGLPPAEGALSVRVGATAARRLLVRRLGLPRLAEPVLRTLGAPRLTAEAELDHVSARLTVPALG